MNTPSPGKVTPYGEGGGGGGNAVLNFSNFFVNLYRKLPCAAASAVE